MDTRFNELTLLIPERGDIERDAVADAWVRGGGTVLRVGRFWDPPAVDPERTRVYGNDTFCLVLAQKLGLELVSPPDDLLGRLEPALVGRAIEFMPLADIERLQYPVFAKSAVPKLFSARIYESAQELLDEARGLEQETLVLASEIVVFTAEVRAFVLDGVVVTLAAYEGRDVAVDDARSFASRAAATRLLPRTCVLDVGPIYGRSWAVIESNASWGAGLNGCDPVAAASCIAAACSGGAST
jgi:hypothetical protein